MFTPANARNAVYERQKIEGDSSERMYTATRDGSHGLMCVRMATR